MVDLIFAYCWQIRDSMSKDSAYDFKDVAS